MSELACDCYSAICEARHLHKLDFTTVCIVFHTSPLPHLITLSALASTLGGTVRPIWLAVLRLITSSNFVGCSTGRSAGFAPFRILSTYLAARRYKSLLRTL